MVMKDSRLLPELELGLLLGKYQVIAAYLFGSRADGTASEDSDYDFAILTDTGYPQDDGIYLTTELKEEMQALLEKEVDLVLLNKASTEFRFLVIKHGRLIFSANEDKRTDFEDIVIRDYLDFKPFLDLYRKEVREAIKEGHFYG
jgi:uncharacterized protein